MALTINTADYLIESDASILDLPAFHAELRDWEDSAEGAIHPVTHRWKALDQGGGAFVYQADVLSPWRVKFPVAGNYTIKGNLNATIVPTPDAYVEREKATAYITTAIGGSGPSLEDIAAAAAAATVAALRAANPPVPVDVQQMNGADVIGDGTSGNKWRGNV